MGNIYSSTFYMVILIDNGHGKNTSGKCSPLLKSSNIKVYDEFIEDDRFKEWKYTRFIADDIVNKLQAMGYDARLLVKEDTDISLIERVKRINKICTEKGAANVLVVSVHANAAGNASKWMEGRGWECYTTIGKTNSDVLAEFLYGRARKNLQGQKMRCDFSDGDSDKESNFTIIKNANCVAVLTENFFYDNKEDLKYMTSDEGVHAIVRTHIEGIIDYIEHKNGTKVN